MGVTIFLGPILGLKKMVGPRRLLRRFLTPGTLKRSENPTHPDGEFTTARFNERTAHESLPSSL